MGSELGGKEAVEMLWLPREIYTSKEGVSGQQSTYCHREQSDGACLWWGKDGAVLDFVVMWNLFIVNNRNSAH